MDLYVFSHIYKAIHNAKITFIIVKGEVKINNCWLQPIYCSIQQLPIAFPILVSCSLWPSYCILCVSYQSINLKRITKTNKSLSDRSHVTDHKDQGLREELELFYVYICQFVRHQGRIHQSRLFRHCKWHRKEILRGSGVIWGQFVTGVLVQLSRFHLTESNCTANASFSPISYPGLLPNDSLGPGYSQNENTLKTKSPNSV